MNLQSPKRLGALLIGFGALVWAANSRSLGSLPEFLLTLLFFGFGALFWLTTFERLRLWQRIVGLAVIGILAIINAGAFAGTVATGFIAMAFALVYWRRPRHWWAIIPAGVMASVTLLITAAVLFPRWDASPLLFLGLAATFTLLYLLPKERGGKRWALYPAILWILLTVLVNDPAGKSPGWLLPALLIGGGVLILWLWQRNSDSG
ncbi:MAG: hypothetical protein JSV66_06565 [Trueperaceae bacterium]|nr:MAG: hypothetical protein JSV66_06565 [Trueperaceae bacterium]